MPSLPPPVVSEGVRADVGVAASHPYRRARETDERESLSRPIDIRGCDPDGPSSARVDPSHAIASRFTLLSAMRVSS